MVSSLTFSAALLFASVALGAPAARSGVMTLSAAEVSAFKPYTKLANAARCPASATATWSCGPNCDAVPGFVPHGAGGDGGLTQFWYVGYDPNTKSVIVGHQGTDTAKILPLIENGDFFLTTPSQALFPGLPVAAKAHNGFLGSHSRSAAGVFDAVNKTLAATGVNLVTTVGHSLGGALALLDAVSLRLRLPPTVTVKSFTYGLPRTGNPTFANWVDDHIPDFVHVNNKEDIVPILPGRFLGFAHPDGEKHVIDSDAWVACAGQDNTDSSCIVGHVGSIFQGKTGMHDGPYDGITIGC